MDWPEFGTVHSRLTNLYFRDKDLFVIGCLEVKVIHRSDNVVKQRLFVRMNRQINSEKVGQAFFSLWSSKWWMCFRLSNVTCQMFYINMLFVK